MKQYQVYIVRCGDGTFYTGIALDAVVRTREHNMGRGAKYTRGRLPVVLQVATSHMIKSKALKLEIEVKKLKNPRQKINRILNWKP